MRYTKARFFSLPEVLDMQKFHALLSDLRHRDLLSWIGCWSAGLLTGTYLAVSADPSFFHGMSVALFCRGSIPGLLTAVFLPFLLSACATAISFRFPLLLIAFFRACAFAYLGTALDLAYGSAGWLLRFLFQFSSILTLPLFCWFCLKCYRCAGGSRRSLIRDLFICFLIAAIAVLADHFAAAPLLSYAVNH